MSIYTFYFRKLDAGAAHFEAHDLDGDPAAAERARELLGQHRSALHVDVYERDRPVLTQSRAWAGT